MCTALVNRLCISLRQGSVVGKTEQLDMTKIVLIGLITPNKTNKLVMVGFGEDVVYLTSVGCPTDIGLQLAMTCYPCSR